MRGSSFGYLVKEGVKNIYANRLIKVLLPAPDGPTMNTNSPRSIRMLKLLSACVPVL